MTRIILGLVVGILAVGYIQIYVLGDSRTLNQPSQKTPGPISGGNNSTPASPSPQPPVLPPPPNPQRTQPSIAGGLMLSRAQVVNFDLLLEQQGCVGGMAQVFSRDPSEDGNLNRDGFVQRTGRRILAQARGRHPDDPRERFESTFEVFTGVLVGSIMGRGLEPITACRGVQSGEFRIQVPRQTTLNEISENVIPTAVTNGTYVGTRLDNDVRRTLVNGIERVGACDGDSTSLSCVLIREEFTRARTYVVRQGLAVNRYDSLVNANQFSGAYRLLDSWFGTERLTRGVTLSLDPRFRYEGTGIVVRQGQQIRIETNERGLLVAVNGKPTVRVQPPQFLFRANSTEELVFFRERPREEGETTQVSFRLVPEER